MAHLQPQPQTSVTPAAHQSLREASFQKTQKNYEQFTRTI